MKVNPVLYVEDDENDVFFMQRAWKSVALANRLDVARDGNEAVDYCCASTQLEPRVSLILLDLNLPRRPGLDVLKWIRQEPAWCTVPVIIFSASHHDEDVHHAYRLGANAYLVKPSRAEELGELLKAVRGFWLQRNHPPPNPGQFEESRDESHAR